MNSDDPKFTAYALDELDPTERAEIGQLLRDDPAVAAEVEATRAFAGQLRTRLQTERAEPLRPGQRRHILASAAPARPRVVIPFSSRAATWAALAACVLVGVGLALLFPAINAMKETPSPGAYASAAAKLPKMRDGSEVQVGLDEGFEPREVMQMMIAESDPSAGVPAPPSPAATPATLGLAPAKVEGSGELVGRGIGRLAQIDKLPGPSTAYMKLSPDTIAQPSPKTMSGGALFSEPNGPRPESLASARGRRGKMVEDRLAVAGQRNRFLNGGDVTKLNLSTASEEAFSDRPAERDDYALHPENPGTESYDDVTDNAFLKVTDAPLSTFSIDVDTASYANVRRFLNGNTLPPKAAVRIEELVNYFHYDYPQPDGDTPFSAAMEVATCPWAPEHRLLRVGLHGRDIARNARPASNLIFLIDVSGSMQPENKLPLLKRSLQLMVDQLGERDQVGIVVYAGAAGCVLQPTHSKEKIRAALDRLESGGSTHGSAGLQLAYDLAGKHFIKGGTNRVILATDGDWNVGTTDKGDLWGLIEKKAKSGVFLTVLGFGMDNLKDDMLEKLADKGNGNYAYIDTLNEGRKVLVDELGATLVTIAKDVKIQIEFNPAQVGAYRLIGYENRVLAAKDFADDTKDAGEIGAGHSVTAFYEIVPAGKEIPAPAPAPEALKYQPAPEPEKPAIRNPQFAISDEMLTLKLRYKAPDGDKSTLREFPLKDSGRRFENSSREFRFAAAVAGYGMLLRGSPHKGSTNWELVHELAVEGKGEDRDGYRAEFVGLVEKARALQR